MDFVHSGRAASPRCGSRCGRQEALPPRARVPGRVRACARGMLAAGFCPVPDDCATQYPRALSNPVPPPGRQVLATVCSAPRGGAPPRSRPSCRTRRPHPPAGGWESGSGWCSRSPGAGAERGGGSHDPKAVHLPPPPPLPHLWAWEQRCFVPAANTSSLRLREWGRVGPQPGEKVRGGKGQAPAPRWARAHH